MSQDPLRALLRLAEEPSGQGLASVDPKAAKALLKLGRNQSIAWLSLLELAAARRAKGQGGEAAWEPARRLLALGLPADFADERGRGPLGLAIARGDWGLAEGALSLGTPINAPDKGGKLPLALAAEELAREKAPASTRFADGAAFLARAMGSKGFDPAAGDQGHEIVRLAIKGALMTWARVPNAGGPAAAAQAAATVWGAAQAAGVDLNAARLRQELSARWGSQIVTPIAYLVKACAQWDEMFGALGSAPVKECAERLVEGLLEAGADPSLQLEGAERNALIEAARRSAFGERVASRLERAILGQHIGVGAASQEGAGGARRGGRRL